MSTTLQVLLRIVVIAAAFTGPAVRAEEAITLILDPEATKIRFTLGATLHKVEGSVAVLGGEIRFRPHGGPASGEIVVDATSADTGHEGRDEDMHRKVLESGDFGRFVLTPTKTVGRLSESGASSIELHGELAIHGGAHPVVLPAQLTVEGDALSGSASFEVPYVEWGMKNPSKLFLRVEKLVSVEIDLAGRLSESPEAVEKPTG